MTRVNPRRMPRTRRPQAGASLVSMMVGLVISLITIGAMLAVYRTAATVSTAASATTQREGQLASALLGAQIDLQQAGFGLEAGEAGLEVTPTRVVWRYRHGPGEPLLCAGLQVGTTGQGADAAATLFQLQEKACAGALEAGPARPLVVLPSAIAGDPSLDAGHVALPGLRFEQADDSGCLPYEQHRDHAPSAPAGTDVFSVCLPNLGKRVRLAQEQQ